MPREAANQDLYIAALHEAARTIREHVQRGTVRKDLRDLFQVQAVSFSVGTFLNQYFKRSGFDVLAASDDETAPLVKSAVSRGGFSSPVREVVVRNRIIDGRRQVQGAVSRSDRIALVIGVLKTPGDARAAVEAISYNGGKVSQIVAVVFDPKAREKVRFGTVGCTGVMTFKNTQESEEDGS